MLPKSTEFNKKIPKQKFDFTLEERKLIKAIYWKNKVAKTTTNYANGEKIKEIEIFRLLLNEKELNEKVLKKIDKAIPYHIIFVLEYDDKKKLIASHKEIDAQGKVKLGAYFQTPWQANIDIELVGIDLDEVYENLIRYIAKDRLEKNEEETLEQALEKNKIKEELKKQISTLEAKIRREKQLNRKMELNSELKKLKRRLGN